jgi:hypothetical protein
VRNVVEFWKASGRETLFAGSVRNGWRKSLAMLTAEGEKTESSLVGWRKAFSSAIPENSIS